jgi:hypothetical protein
VSVAGQFPPRDSTNGWAFWEYRATDGESHPLDDLRQELHEERS